MRRKSNVVTLISYKMAINRKREQLCKDIRITACLRTFEKCRVKMAQNIERRETGLWKI